MAAYFGYLRLIGKVTKQNSAGISTTLPNVIRDLQSRETPQRKGVRVLRQSKTAITLQSLNVNYPVLPRPYSAVRAL